VTSEACFHCAWCGDENSVSIDAEGGRTQRYVEDCQTCCRPNLLTITIDADGEAWIDAERENG
jgi:hypothetical protein